jgi:hypothetical protein
MSAKETDNPIGQFGSGLKFAIAILLRTGHEVTIHSGSEVYNFETKATFFRGQEFDIVTCNGKELGMTTQMGKHWELWMAYRELVCNTMDEGGMHFGGTAMPDGTSIVVKGDNFHELLSRHEEFFVGEREPICEFNGVKAYRGNGTIFYRGVKVGALPKARYSYELSGSFKLTEDRTLLQQPAAVNVIMSCLVGYCENKSFIESVITLDDEWWESEQDYEWSWGDTFTEVVGRVWQEAPTKLNKKVKLAAPKRLGHKEWDEIEMSERETAMLNSAMEYLKKIEYPIDFKISLIEYKDRDALAFTKSKVLYLGRQAFRKGTMELVKLLLKHRTGIVCGLGSIESYLLDELLEKASIAHNAYL